MGSSVAMDRGAMIGKASQESKVACCMQMINGRLGHDAIGQNPTIEVAFSPGHDVCASDGRAEALADARRALCGRM